MKLLVTLAVFVDKLCDFHIVSSNTPLLLCDFRELAVFEPADRLQAFRSFFHTERRGRD